MSQHRVRKGHREEKALFCAKRDAIKDTSIRITVLEVREKLDSNQEQYSGRELPLLNGGWAATMSQDSWPTNDKTPPPCVLRRFR